MVLDSEEKYEPASDIDAVMVDSLKALDPERPIREADCCSQISVRGDDGARAIGVIDDVGGRRRD